MSSTDDDERPFDAALPRAASGRPTRSPRGRERVARRAARSIVATAGVELELRRPRQLLHDLDERPVGDALAVGEAAAADDRLRPSSEPRNSAARRDLPTPATPRTVNSWQALVVDRLRERLLKPAQLALAADERRVEAAREGRSRPGAARAGGSAATGSLLPFSSSGSTGLGLDGVADELRRSRRRAAPRRRRAACSSRAATLTASPVASRSPVPDDHLARVDADPRLHAELGRARRASRRAARTARSASSSCSCGTPKTAITASPMNFSTVAAVALDDRLHPLEVAARAARAAPPGRSTRRARSSRRRRRRGP